MILVDPPEAPFEIIYDADTSDTLLNIVPPAGSQRMYLNAPGDKLDGWNKKKQTGSHTVWSTRNSDYDTGVVGTLRVLNEVSDGIYLTNVDGSKKGLHLLPAGIAVDTTDHTITEEFVIQNDSLGSDIQVIDDGSSTMGWLNADGTGVISVDTGRLKVVGNAAASGKHSITIPKELDLSSKAFITVEIECTNACYLMFTMKSNTYYIGWTSGTTRFPIAANTRTKFVLPINAPPGSTGSNPVLRDASYSNASIIQLSVGVIGLGSEVANTFYVGNIQACNGTWARVEVAVPDKLLPLRVRGYTWDGSTYGTAISNFIGIDPTNAGNYNASLLRMLDATTAYSILGNAHVGCIAGYDIGTSAETANRLVGGSYNTTITYSSTAGTSKRIGFAIKMPPYGSGNPNLSKCRLQLKIYYDDENGNVVKDLSGCGNNGTIVGGVTKLNSGGLLFDGSSGYINCGNSSTLNLGVDDFTIFIDINNPSSSKELINKYSSGSVGYRISVGPTLTCWGNYNGISYDISVTSGEVSTGRHRIALIADRDTEIRWYVDGVQSGNADATQISASLSNSVRLYIGTEGWAKSSFYNNNLYELRIYKRAITSNELVNLVNGVSIDPTGLVLHYNPTVSNIGSTTFEFTPQSLDHFTGLDNVGNWIAFERPDKRAEVFLFSRKLASLAVTEDENGYITNIEVGVKKGTKVARSWVRYPDFDADGNSDDVPNFIDKIVEQLQNKFAFTRKYTNEVDLSGMAVVENDFEITLEAANPVYPVSHGARVYDSQGNLLTPVETITTADGNLDLVEVYGKSSIKVFGDENLNYGECKVFDTVTAGNIDESTWLRVYDVNHVFTGDTVVDNGLCRFAFMYSGVSLLHVLRFFTKIGSNWISYSEVQVVGNNYIYPFRKVVFTILQLDANCIRIRIDKAYRVVDFECDSEVSIRRGDWFVKLLPGTVINANENIFSYPNERFILGTEIYDAAFENGADSFTELTDNNRYHVLFTPGDGVIKMHTSASNAGYAYQARNEIPSVSVCRQRSGDKPQYFGAIPYSQQMYWEAEAFSGGSPNTELYTGTDAYPFTGNTGIRFINVDGNASYVCGFGKFVPNMEYKIFVRAKADSVTNGLRVYLRGVTWPGVYKTLLNIPTVWASAIYTFTLTESDCALIDRIWLYSVSATPINIDYILIVPTGLIESHAKRALVNLNEVKTYKEV